MAFENFPYTDLHNLNLDWIIRRIRELEAIGKTVEEIHAIIREELNRILGEWLNDGTLAQIINQAIFSALNKEVYLNRLGYKYDADRKARYQDAVRENVVSYLLKNAGGTYFDIGGPVGSPNVIYKYNNPNTWQSYRWGSTPIYTDTETINGVVYKILYLDCSSFTALITSNISYDNSPYAAAWAGADTETIRKAGYPSMLAANDFAYDFNGLCNTDQMSLQLRDNGNVPLVLETRNLGEDPVLNADNLAMLETGDILFSGSGASGVDLYSITGHCMVYIADLQELNNTQAAQAAGVQFRAVDNGDSQYGYIVEMAYSLDDTDYRDCLRIFTLDGHMRRNLTNAQNITYAYKAAANGFNSNVISHWDKAIFRDYNRLYFMPIHYTDPLASLIRIEMASGSIIAKSFNAEGIQLTAGEDANDWQTGVYKCTSNATVGTFLNMPIGNDWFIYVGIGAMNAARTAWVGNQVVLTINTSNPRIFTRAKGELAFSAWKEITLT